MKIFEKIKWIFPLLRGAGLMATGGLIVAMNIREAKRELLREDLINIYMRYINCVDAELNKYTEGEISGNTPKGTSVFVELATGQCMRFDPTLREFERQKIN